jgi:hypothetical protein
MLTLELVMPKESSSRDVALLSSTVYLEQIQSSSHFSILTYLQNHWQPISREVWICGFFQGEIKV